MVVGGGGYQWCTEWRGGIVGLARDENPPSGLLLCGFDFFLIKILVSVSKSQSQSNVWRSTTKRYHQPRASYQLCKHVVIQAYLNERYATFGFRDQYYLQWKPTQFKTGPDGSNMNLDWQAGHRGGRLTSLDASFARCFAFWRTSSKTSTSMFFQKNRQNIASLRKKHDVLHDVLGFRNSTQSYDKSLVT